MTDEVEVPYDQQIDNELIQLFQPMAIPPWDFTPPILRAAEGLTQNNYCVLDGFFGMENALALRTEIISYHTKGLMKDGEIGAGKLASSRGAVGTMRSDKIVWFEGSEPVCPLLRRYILFIDVFAHKLCALMGSCFAEESKWAMGGRSKAMATLYPASGTRYVPHFDNPNGDGRKLSCVYNLNPNWESSHGGSIRVKTKRKTIEIGPLCDRLAIFWSDRRCPHEVLPSFRDRYAVTVWFFDDNERAKAVAAPQT